MKLKLIPEWRKAWKFASVQVLVVLQFLPDVLRAFLDYAPDTMDLTIYRGALIVATAARLLYQPKVRDEDPK